jgi:hypothetical protein
MADQISKVMIFLKRRPGMSVAEFRDYYENSHSKLCEKYAAGALRYARRYIDFAPDPVTGEAVEKDFDVITELWFADRAVADTVVEIGQSGRMPAEVIADEERVFDRSKIRYAVVTEYESDLDAVRRAVANA